MENMDMMANMAEMDKCYAALSHKSHALSAHQDPLDLKVKLETKDHEDPKERMEKMAKTEILDPKEWPDLLEIKDLLDHLACLGQKENQDVSTKSMDLLDLTDPLDHPVELDPKEIPVSTVYPVNQDHKDHLEKLDWLVAKAYPVLLAPLVKADLLAKLELATTAQHQELHQAIKLREHGKLSKTLTLGAFLLQETVLFDNAQFLCFIFFVLWHTTR